MTWLQAHLDTTRDQISTIESLFDGLGALSITLGDATNEATPEYMLEPAPGETPLWQITRITGLFEGSTDTEWLKSQLDQELAKNLTQTPDQTLPSPVRQEVKLEVLQDQDWERTWLERFHPMCFGEHLWICPRGQDAPAKDAVVVSLDPGLAFGTGTHPTTSLCLSWLDQINPRDQALIDVGCGSGILAIAALKLGATQALAIDHDPQALIATQDNARQNGVLNMLEVSDHIPQHYQKKDILVANILANVLIELAPQLIALLKPGGFLALSGILHHQADAIIAAFADRVNLAPLQQQEEWCLLHGRVR